MVLALIQRLLFFPDLIYCQDARLPRQLSGEEGVCLQDRQTSPQQSAAYSDEEAGDAEDTENDGPALLIKTPAPSPPPPLPPPAGTAAAAMRPARQRKVAGVPLLPAVLVVGTGLFIRHIR